MAKPTYQPPTVTRHEITGVRLEREPDPPGPVFTLTAIDGLATAEVRGRDSAAFAISLVAGLALAPDSPQPETLQQQWDAAAGDLHDAAARLVAIADAIEDQKTDTFNDAEAERRENDATSFEDLDLPHVVDMAEATEDLVVPDWVEVSK